MIKLQKNEVSDKSIPSTLVEVSKHHCTQTQQKNDMLKRISSTRTLKEYSNTVFDTTEELKRKDIEINKSLYCFSSSNPIRQTCITIVLNPWFDHFILFLIILSSVCVILDEPGLDPKDPLKKFLMIADKIFTILFLVEM